MIHRGKTTNLIKKTLQPSKKWWCVGSEQFEAIATTENLELRAWQAIYARFISSVGTRSLQLLSVSSRCTLLALCVCVLRWCQRAGLMLVICCWFWCSRHHIWSHFIFLFSPASTIHTFGILFLRFITTHSYHCNRHRFARIHARTHLHSCTLSYTHTCICIDGYTYTGAINVSVLSFWMQIKLKFVQ